MNFSKVIGILIGSALFFSCKKNEITGVEDVKYTGPKMVSFNNYDGYQQATIPALDSFITIEYEVKLSNTTSTADAPIKVKFVKDNSAISEYNTINGTNLSPVPVTAYRFDQTEITIPKGSRIGKVKFQVNPTKLLSVTSPAFGISIFSVSGDGATVINDATQTHLVVEIAALNQWDGIYSSSLGYFYHPTAARVIPNGIAKHCYTTGANTVATELGDFNGVAQPATYYVTLTIDPVTNRVSIGPGPGTQPSASPVVTLTSLPGMYQPFTGSTPSIYNNTWNPNTRKFFLRYGYYGGANLNEWRVVEEVLTKQ